MEKTTFASAIQRLALSLGILGFGLACLAYLVAIDRPHWFVLKPATGTAAAMAKASVPPSHS